MRDSTCPASLLFAILSERTGAATGVATLPEAVFISVLRAKLGFASKALSYGFAAGCAARLLPPKVLSYRLCRRMCGEAFAPKGTFLPALPPDVRGGFASPVASKSMRAVPPGSGFAPMGQRPYQGPSPIYFTQGPARQSLAAHRAAKP